ncbi:peptidase M61 [Caulobacter sp. SL161]|uniref:M61 family metallopeptidase n=1 Tax=Caulobacter sp. SL161 TaxID=2995156 RepID=UPI002274766A|nr:peptidase M61 [Caulobacter sp. SL161]MCY1648946.1 peptidase M61 [Caulobacter sp. SL161]
MGCLVKALFFSVSVLSLVATAALAQTPTLAPTPAPSQPWPESAAPSAPIPAPQDIPYAGTLKLAVDATDLDRKIWTVTTTIPVSKAGAFTFLYPQWVPGGHSPRNDLDKLAGLVVTANGKPLPWKRDVVSVHAFHVDVPADVSEIQVSYQFLTAVESRIGRIQVTQEMLNLQWLQVAVYPAGYYTRQIPIEASVKLPEGWKLATALKTAKVEGQVTTFKPTTVETLVDSPIFAGKYFKSIDLDPTGPAPVRLNLVADSPELLEAKPEHIQVHKDLVQQAYKLFGSHHYDHYDFLVALSDRLGGIGLEHHRSSENRVTPKYFTEWDKSFVGRDLLPHEFTHSWNGKFRRAADIWTPNLNVPMRDSLMWVYEGQTQYWGYVLSARAGFLTKQQTLDAIAATAATYDNRRGRDWRPVQDTTNDPIIAQRRPLSWLSWQRSEDYYSEGQLVWLDADTLIREKTGGKKSLDDFAKAFFGVDNGSYVPRTYVFEDVVAALNGVVAHDWAAFLKTRIEEVQPKAPLDGLERGGYKLVYTETPTEFMKAAETRSRGTALTYSLGLSLGSDGVISDVQWGGPAFKAGLTQGLTVVAVNGEQLDSDKLKAAVKAAAKPENPLVELLIKDGFRYKMVKIDYRGGLRYPRLERIAGAPDRLGDILTPRK